MMVTKTTKHDMMALAYLRYRRKRTMNSAPVMVLGVIVGVLLCFSGNPLKRFWFPIRSLAFGALTLTLAVQCIVDKQAIVTLFANSATFSGLLQTLTHDTLWWHTLLKVLAGVVGAVVFFFLGRAKHPVATLVSKILTACTTACAIALLIALGGFAVVTLPMAAVIAGVLAVVFIPICVQRFDYYFAAETGLAGALLTSYMFSRFYYLSPWLFWLLAVLLAFCGIYLQERAAIRKRNRTGVSPDENKQDATKRKARKTGNKRPEQTIEFTDPPVEEPGRQAQADLPHAEKE